MTYKGTPHRAVSGTLAGSGPRQGSVWDISSYAKGSAFPALVLFLAGALLRLDVYIVGRISVGELLLVLVSLRYWGQLLAESRHVKAIRAYVLLLGIWVLAILISDFVNGTDRGLILRGLARPLVVVSMFVACWGLLRNNPRAFMWFFYGLLISAIGNLIFKTDFRVSDQLERDTYGYAAFVYTPVLFSVTTLAGFYLSRYGTIWPKLLFVAVFVVASEQFSRTTTASFLVAALLFQAVVFFRDAAWAKRFTVGSIILVAIVSLLAAYVALRIYIGLAVDGTFGDRLTLKVLMQSRAPTGDPVVNMFLSARYGLISCFLMIKDFPFFGSGSWPVEGPYVVKALEFLQKQLSAVIYYDIIPRRGTGHSILFGSWANYGPLATLFWIYMLVKVIGLYKEFLLSGSRIYWLVAPYLVTFLFSIPFNNLNSINRVFAALLPALVIVVTVANRQSMRNEPVRGGRHRFVRRVRGPGAIDA